MKFKTYCFVASSSGGHILPALNRAYDYQKNDPAARILFITGTGPIDTNIMRDQKNIEHVSIALQSVPHHQWYKLPMFAFNVVRSWMKSVRVLYHAKPERVITTGSYLAVPVCLAAWILRIPIELIELNVEPGMAISYLAPFATTVSICFEETKQFLPRTQCTLTPYPLSPALHSLHITRGELIQELKLNSDKKTILVIGGSQGSVSLNNAIKNMIENHAPQNLQFIHQTGSYDETDWQHFYAAHGITAYAFTYDPQLMRYYAAADCIITRAGSGSLHESMFFKKPCIVIPLITKTTAHQHANALAMQKRYPDLVQVIEQKKIEQNDLLLSAIERAYQYNTLL